MSTEKAKKARKPQNRSKKDCWGVLFNAEENKVVKFQARKDGYITDEYREIILDQLHSSLTLSGKDGATGNTHEDFMAFLELYDVKPEDFTNPYKYFYEDPVKYWESPKFVVAYYAKEVDRDLKMKILRRNEAERIGWLYLEKRAEDLKKYLEEESKKVVSMH